MLPRSGGRGVNRDVRTSTYTVKLLRRLYCISYTVAPSEARNHKYFYDKGTVLRNCWPYFFCLKDSTCIPFESHILFWIPSAYRKVESLKNSDNDFFYKQISREFCVKLSFNWSTLFSWKLLNCSIWGNVLNDWWKFL